MKFLTEDTFQSGGEIGLKLIRAKQSSGQLSTGFIGRMAHDRLHRQIEHERGDKFNLAGFHRAVIARGPIAVQGLPELVRADPGLAR